MVAFASFMGFIHSFEADHLLAVSNIVTKRDSLILAVKDGVFWGLGHTSTIFVVGIIIILGKMMVAGENPIFSYFESIVGLMLMSLGFYRLFKIYKLRQHIATHHAHTHLHDHSDNHSLAYGVGLIHGLAGSGVVVLTAIGTVNGSFNALVFILIFGLGSMVGMLLASGVFSLPFSKKITSNKALQVGLTVLSSILCIGFGAKVVVENLL